MLIRNRHKPDTREDLHLVQRIVSGDERAFDAFYEGYMPRVYRFALRRLGCREDAEDAVQRTFMKALRGLERYRGDAVLFTWLCTICRREIHDLVRERGRSGEMKPLIEDDAEVRSALEFLEPAAEPSPEHAAIAADIVQLVHATLDHLPPRYGDVLSRRYLRGESINDIAASLGLGRDAADSLLARARRAFREGFDRVMQAAGLTLSELTPGPDRGGTR